MEMERITSAVDCVKCVPIPVIKQDDPPLWVAENWMTHPFSAPAHLPPNTYRPVCYAAFCKT